MSLSEYRWRGAFVMALKIAMFLWLCGKVIFKTVFLQQPEFHTATGYPKMILILKEKKCRDAPVCPQMAFQTDYLTTDWSEIFRLCKTQWKYAYPIY